MGSCIHNGISYLQKHGSGSGRIRFDHQQSDMTVLETRSIVIKKIIKKKIKEKKNEKKF